MKAIQLAQPIWSGNGPSVELLGADIGYRLPCKALQGTARHCKAPQWATCERRCVTLRTEDDDYYSSAGSEKRSGPSVPHLAVPHKNNKNTS